MKVFAFVPRYWFHSFMSGARRQSYQQWRELMIDADYTFVKALTSYQHGWRRLRIWRWVIFHGDFMWNCVLFLIALVRIKAKA